ncbi:hypothetical protein [Anaerobiospirillum sp. NML120449]|uniref:hypothetical protein n=1 Tax=Anaerobiospirillum sp. NML120449 TaxID=2932817 RepID=UPI001FF4C0EE|nr:hypothetical protein [Anaerobiospirillum sp. NML120449]MCK0527389.1 hypothetical protein [Anaerobiospirillum sp. NML120449]
MRFSSIKTRLLASFLCILFLSCLVSGLSIRSMYSSISIASDLQTMITVQYRQINTAKL